MKHVLDRLPDFLMETLQRNERAEVEAHLNECSMCRDEFDTLLRLWAKLGALPAERPSDQVRTRFFNMLEAYQEGLRHAAPSAGILASLNAVVEKFWPSQPAVQLALALMLVLLGIAAGTRMTGETEDTSELAQLRGEVRHMGRMLTVSLLSQQSASERLRGVAWSQQMDVPDEQVINALLRALKLDSNVNVRLAAIDALSRFVGNPEVGREVIETLPRETSPLVQIAMIDFLVETRQVASTEVLTDMAKDPKVDKTVRQRIDETLKELSL